MKGAEQLAGALFTVIWAVILWTRRDLKGISKRHAAYVEKQERWKLRLVRRLIKSEPDAKKKDEFTDLLED